MCELDHCMLYPAGTDTTTINASAPTIELDTLTSALVTTARQPIIVVARAPVSAATTLQSAQDQNTQTLLNAFNQQNERINEHKQVVDKVLELVSKQYDHVSISDVRTEHWQPVERFLHLKVFVQPPPEAPTTTATTLTVPSFAWDARSEPQHFTDYLQYLQHYIRIEETDLTWNKKKPSTHLLDIYATSFSTFQSERKH